jgi:hypothetical protein
MFAFLCTPQKKLLMKFITALLFIIFGITLTAQTITYTPLKNFTKDTKFPPEVRIQNSNNNLDLISFEDRYYVVFRTAPSHFASPNTWLYVVSSADLDHWAFEDSIHLGYDMREPRFYAHHDTLFLIFFRGGKKMLRFQPNEVLVAYRTKTTGWTKPINVGLDGYVPWRVRTRSDTLYLSAYYGKHLYHSSHKPDLRLLSSTDGFKWTRLSVEPQLSLDAVEEGEFIFDRLGDMYGVARLESSGSLLTYASHDSLSTWHSTYSPYKYDSPLLLNDNDDIYLLSRRSLGGKMTKAPKWMTARQARNFNLFIYPFSHKVTSIFKYNTVDKVLVHLIDFPSTGDTAYPAITKLGPGKFLFMNYSTNINGRKKIWLGGQLGKTYIYSTILQISK